MVLYIAIAIKRLYNKSLNIDNLQAMLPLDKKNLRTFLTEVKNKKVCIVGDSILDIFSYGKIERISPEAPVPIIELEAREFIPGGAANVARNITSLGCKATLFTILGKDENGILLEKSLKKDKVEVVKLLTNTRPTTVKERIIEGCKHFVRIDIESKQLLTKQEETKLIQKFKKVVDTTDVLIFSDYSKGVITERLVSEFCKIAHKKKIPIIVDTKPSNAKLFCKKHISLFTPNAKEAIEISSKENFEDSANYLQEYFSSAVLITKGGGGMTLYNGKEITHVDALSANVVDVSGCGDTVIAVLGMALATKKSMSEAIYFANHAAGIVVQKKGTAIVKTLEFVNYYDR